MQSESAVGSGLWRQLNVIHICYRDNRREIAGCLATDEDESKQQKWVMTEEESDDIINPGQH